mgnify:CR=1 FL=1
MMVGSDNNLDNGFQEFESLVWLVERADGVVYNANVTTATAGFDGAYEDGEFVIISSVTIGAPLYDGCMEADNAKAAADIQLKVAELQTKEDTEAIKLAMEAARDINDRD